MMNWNHLALQLQWGAAIGASLVAAMWDVRTHRIPNVLSVPVLALGLLMAGWCGGLHGLGDGVAGALLLGRFFDREGSFKFLALTYLGAAATIFLIGEAGVSVPLLTLTVFAAGIGVIGGQTGSNALTAEFYPTAIRSTGVGWALGIGRIGSIIGPTLGGTLLAMGGQTRHIFWAAAIPPLIATAAALSAALIQKRRVTIQHSSRRCC